MKWTAISDKWEDIMKSVVQRIGGSVPQRIGGSVPFGAHINEVFATMGQKLFVSRIQFGIDFPRIDIESVLSIFGKLDEKGDDIVLDVCRHILR